MIDILRSLDTWPEIFLTAVIGLFIVRVVVYCLLGRVFGWYDYRTLRFFYIPGWRMLVRVWAAVRDWTRELFAGGRPQARLAGFLERAAMTDHQGYPLGRNRFCGFPLFQTVYAPKNEDAHQFVFGQTGSSKTVSSIAVLNAHEGSSILVDPSGQATKVLFERCGAGGPGILGKNQPAFCLDPDHQVRLPGFVSNKWNYYDEIDRAVERDGPDAAILMFFILAEALIVKPKENSKAFFEETARRAVEGVGGFVYDEYPPGHPDRNLVTVRKLMRDGLDEPERPDDVTPREWLLLRMVEKGDQLGGIISSRARMLLEASRSASGDVWATAISATAWLDLPQLQKISSGRSDFLLEDFKGKKKHRHLSMVAAVTHVSGIYKGWFRLFVMTLLHTFETIPGSPKKKCLLICDEFSNLGFIPTFSVAPGHVRKFGLRLVLMAQSVDIGSVYPNIGEMIGNASSVTWLRTDDDKNIAMIAAKLGKASRREKVDGGWFRRDQPRYQGIDRWLRDESDIKEFLDRGNLIVTRRRNHLLLAPLRYFVDCPVWSYRADPDHGEGFFRRAFRLLCIRRIPGPELLSERSDGVRDDNMAGLGTVQEEGI